MILLMLTAFGADAEGERLVDEYMRYTKDGKWVAVERTYLRLLENHPDSLNNPIHHAASKAARQRGDLLIAAQRLLRSKPDGLARDAIDGDLQSLRTSTGMVMFVGAKLEPQAMPFAPDQRLAVQVAQKAIADSGHFVGLLPAGTYNLDGKEVEVTAGFRWTDAWSGGSRG